MTITNEYERNLNDTSFLKRPGRIDLVVFQNTPDAGDGHPGLQRCFRNYLHEGGIEKDIDLVGHGIKGTSVDLTNAKLQEFNNIGATTISAGQWIFVGQANQDVRTSDSPTFVGLTLSADLITTSTVDGVNVGDLKSSFDTHVGSTGASHTYIDQSVVNGSSPTFASPNVTNLNLADDIIHVGDTNNLISFGTDTQDFQTGGLSRMDISDSGVRFGATGVRITNIINNDSLGTSDVVLCTQGNVKAYADVIAGNLTTHAGSTGESHTYINQSVITTTSPTFVGLTLSADLITTSTIDGVDVGTFKTNSDAYDAIGSGNAKNKPCVYIGASNSTTIFNTTSYAISNSATGTYSMIFQIPLPPKLGTLNLYVTNIIVGVSDADADNYIDYVRGESNSSYNGLYNWFPANSTNRTSANEYSYSMTAKNLGGYKNSLIRLKIQCRVLNGLSKNINKK